MLPFATTRTYHHKSIIVMQGGRGDKKQALFDRSIFGFGEQLEHGMFHTCMLLQSLSVSVYCNVTQKPYVTFVVTS